MVLSFVVEHENLFLERARLSHVTQFLTWFTQSECYDIAKAASLSSEGVKRAERSRTKMQFLGGSRKREKSVPRAICGKVTSVLSTFSQPGSRVRRSFC
jgi:hypothetical protein